jgi:hypothetical protein
MPRLLTPEIEDMRRLTPSEKAVAALAMMQDGLMLKRTQLRLRHPQATELEIDALLEQWMAADRGG